MATEFLHPQLHRLARPLPPTRRELIVKLANILRKMLNEHDAFVPFRDELATTDDYLSIEIVRFGSEKLSVAREIDPKTLEIPVPSMLRRRRSMLGTGISTSLSHPRATESFSEPKRTISMEIHRRWWRARREGNEGVVLVQAFCAGCRRV